MLHMKQLAEAQGSAKTDYRFIKKSQKRKCKFCGGNHPWGKDNCPARDTVCYTCKEKGHWPRVCPERDEDDSKTASTKKEDSKGQSAHKPKFKGKPKYKPNYKSGSKKVDVYYQDRYSNSDDEYEHVSFSEVRINSVAAEDSEDFVTLDHDLRRKFSADLKVKVDTGAQGNTLPLRIFQRIFPEKLNDAGLPDPRMISRSQTILTTYGGNRLEQLGCITIPCQYSNRSRRDVSFYIVDVEGPAILGLPDLKAFKIVTIYHAIDAAEPVKCTKDLVKMYPKQFDGIGDFKGKYHIVLDKNAQPVVQAKR